MDIITQVQAEIQAVARPLYDRLLLLDEEIGTREIELGELKKARTQLRNVVRGIVPEMLPQAKAKRNTNAWRPKPEHALALHEFLLSHRQELNGDRFHASGLTTQYPKELPIPYSSINKVLAILHEQGTIRLDSTGTGGAKHYRFVA